jgi:hypothetical protein
VLIGLVYVALWIGRRFYAGDRSVPGPAAVGDSTVNKNQPNRLVFYLNAA